MAFQLSDFYELQCGGGGGGALLGWMDYPLCLMPRRAARSLFRIVGLRSSGLRNRGGFFLLLEFSHY